MKTNEARVSFPKTQMKAIIAWAKERDCSVNYIIRELVTEAINNKLEKGECYGERT